MAERRVYLDTSALLPLYRQERLSLRAERLLEETPRPPLVSLLTQVEVASALARWVRTAELESQHAQEIERTFTEDLRLGVFDVVSLEDAHYWQAREWLSTRDTALRTLDALHLACAAGHSAEIVTADGALAEAANRFGCCARLLS